MRKMRKGFTLVELLIVVAIIGVLATMMTLSAGDSATKAKASAIISGFKMVRTAVIMYEAASSDEGPSWVYFKDTASKDYVGPESVGLLRDYTMTSDDDGVWQAQYTYGANATTLGTAISSAGSKLRITIDSDSGVATMPVK